MVSVNLRGRLASRKLRRSVVLLSIIAGWLGACAPVAIRTETMPLGRPTAQPIGALLFCLAQPVDCREDARPAAPVEMTEDLWRQLHEVQISVNRSLDPSAPIEVAWHYSVNGKATCVQYAMEKRRQLIGRGLPASALQLATAITSRGEGHLVLVVNTTRGDWVLDNLRYDVTPWRNLPYQWIAREQGGSMVKWVSIKVTG